MFIQVARVPPEGLDLSGSDDAVFADIAESDLHTARGPVSYRFHANYVCGELIVVGSLTVEVEFPCSRCAVPFTSMVEEKRFEFVHEAPDGTESVDLTEEMREAIVCAFPSHPVCRDACKGLCPRCGKDLNEGECKCSSGDQDRCWGALGGLEL